MASHRHPPKVPADQDREDIKACYDVLNAGIEKIRELDEKILSLTLPLAGLFSRQSRPSPTCEVDNDCKDAMKELENQLKEVESMKGFIEKCCTTVRANANKLSRPFLRNLTILDLPNEILLEIFELVEGFDPTQNHHSWCTRHAMDIKSIRLVSKRFCDVSSQLLVRLVRVNLNEESLAHLVEISCHPTIAKGVCAVEVVLHFHNLSLKDLNRFLTYHADELELQERFIRVWSPEFDEETMARSILEIEAVVSTLRRLASTDANNGGDSEDDLHHRARLGRIHQDYLQLFEKQQSLMLSGNFEQTLGSAIARMPRARKLSLIDADYEQLKHQMLMLAPGAALWDGLYRSMIDPIIGYRAELFGLELPDYSCIISMINSVRGAGAFLDSIDINLTHKGSPRSLILDPDIQQAFILGMQRLKGFRFKLWDTCYEEGNNVIHGFLSACLNTPSLQKLSLDLLGTANNVAARVEVEQLLSMAPRYKLMDIYLARVSLDLPKLSNMLERLPQKMKRLYLYSTGFHVGTWKEALDVLRNTRCDYKIIELPNRDERGNISRDYYEVFKMLDKREDDVFNSSANCYIRSSSDEGEQRQPNLLQALEDEQNAQAAVDANSTEE